MIRVGITGSRRGLTQDQLAVLTVISRVIAPSVYEVHHGDCVGVDVQAVEVFRRHNPSIVAVAWPPKVKTYAANHPSDFRHPPMDYLERNEKIVEAADLLLAFPVGESRGTMHTWRAASELKRPRIRVAEDGFVECLNVNNPRTAPGAWNGKLVRLLFGISQ